MDTLGVFSDNSKDSEVRLVFRDTASIALFVR